MALRDTWQEAPVKPTLDETTIHLWKLPLNVREADFEGALAADERERAARFHFARDRRRFVVRRGHLRRVLSRYVDAAPDALRFKQNAYGKPSLVGEGVQFNLSRSGEWALLAVSRTEPLGVDIEQMSRTIDFMQVAEHTFSPVEVDLLRMLPEQRGLEAFYTLWARKEAFVKWLGKGMTVDLKAFDMTLDGNRVTDIRGDLYEGERPSVFTVDFEEGYAAALVAGAFVWTFMFFVVTLQ